MLREGEAKSFKADDMGEIVCEIEHEDGHIEKNVRIRFPAGLRARPVDSKDGEDQVSFQNGRFLECLAVSARDVTQQIEKKKAIQSGELQIFSLGEQPNGISLTDNKFLIGLSAQKKAAREGDAVDLGTITLTAVPAPMASPPTITFTLAYTDGSSPPVVGTIWGPFVLLGTITLTTNITATWKLKGRIVNGSLLVYIE